MRIILYYIILYIDEEKLRKRLYLREWEILEGIVDLRKIEKEGKKISVNFVSKGQVSTFARAFELNFFTKAHLHVKDKTRGGESKSSFFSSPRIFNKFKRSFLE